MENQDSVDQRRAAVECFFVAHSDVLAEQGSVVATYRRRGDRKLGPYHKLACRIEQRQVAIYLGTDADFIDQVRERLSRLQQARSERLRMSAVRRAFRRQARAVQRELDVELSTRGLFRKGHEIRGWRTAETRLATSQPASPTTAIEGPKVVTGKQPAARGDAQ